VTSRNPTPVEGSGPVGPTEKSDVVVAQHRERISLPVISIQSQDNGNIVTTVKDSLRSCDTCYLSSVCPQMKAHSSCAFSFPVEIRTREQQEAACQALVEFQFARVSMGQFAEQIDGGGLNARQGQEMDRFFKMLETVKTLKAPDLMPGNGAFSRIFGVVELSQPELGASSDEADEEDDWDEADEAEVIYQT
jgi:hypothetical protein